MSRMANADQSQHSEIIGALDTPAMTFIHHSMGQLASPRTFTSNAAVPSLQYPEGITASRGHVFVGT